MPLPYYLIDGYNLLHAAGLSRASYRPGDLERSRTALLIRLADGFDEAGRERTTVVFDAADPPPDADHTFRFRRMAVLFAVEQREADALIEELIRRHPSPRQLRVVSDDVRLQKAARRRGAQAVKSDAFLRRLARYGGATETSRPDAPAATPESAGVGDWLSFFGMGGGAVDVGNIEPSPVVTRGETVASHASRSVPPPVSRSPQTAPANSRKAPSPSTTADDDRQPGEELGFWQQRIDELLREEGRCRATD